MRYPIIASLLTLASLIFMGSAHAYKIYNYTGYEAEFEGGLGVWCFGCFHLNIPNDDSRSCPGNERGCRGETGVRMVIPSNLSAEYYGYEITNEKSIYRSVWLDTPISVTAHGTVIFRRYSVEVYNDRGDLIYNGKPKLGGRPWGGIL